MVEIIPVAGLPEIEPGDRISGGLAYALRLEGQALLPADTLIVTQKIVSKAEGCFVELEGIDPSPQAVDIAERCGKDARFIELVIRESIEILRASPGVLIARHRSGHVMANAGIDQSNLGGRVANVVLLFPADADRSAENIRTDLQAKWPVPFGVVVSDSFGQPWRHGVVNVAIGAAGLASLMDRRGTPDRDGRPLAGMQVAFADLVAAAAGLAMGEGNEGIAAAIVRGAGLPGPANPATALLRPLGEDLFR